MVSWMEYRPPSLYSFYCMVLMRASPLEVGSLLLSPYSLLSSDEEWCIGLFEWWFQRLKGTSTKLFFFLILELLFQRVFSDFYSFICCYMSCFLACLAFLDLCLLVLLELGGTSASCYNFYSSLCYLSYQSFIFLIYFEGFAAGFCCCCYFCCCWGCIFGGYLVFLMLLGELEGFLSLMMLQLFFERMLLASAAAMSPLSSTLLINPAHFSLKLLTLPSLKNLKSLANSGKGTFFSILSLRRSKAEPGKQSAPQTQRHSWTMRKKVLESLTRFIISSSPKSLSISRMKQVLPRWMLLTLDLYSMISAKCTSTDFSMLSTANSDPASSASFRNCSAQTFPAGASQPKSPTTFRIAGLSLGWSGCSRIISSSPLAFSIALKSAMSRKFSTQALRNWSERSSGEAGKGVACCIFVIFKFQGRGGAAAGGSRWRCCCSTPKWVLLSARLIMQQTTVACVRRGGVCVRVGVKELQLGDHLRYGLVITHEAVEIMDLIEQDVCAIIRKTAYPRSARLSRCERFVVAFFTDNTVGVYRTADGSQISKIMGIPRSATTFVLSGNSQRLLFANNQTLCLWSLPRGELEISSNQWRNINCYAIRDDGGQIAIGTYSGALVVLTLITAQRVTEMELRRHKNCVMLIGYCRSGAIISVSYDKLFVKTTISELPTGEKGISYDEIILQSIPRSIQSAGGLIFFTENDGSIGWLSKGNKLIQYSDGMYAVTEHEGGILFMRYKEGEVEWFGRRDIAN